MQPFVRLTHTAVDQWNFGRPILAGLQPNFMDLVAGTRRIKTPHLFINRFGMICCSLNLSWNDGDICPDPPPNSDSRMMSCLQRARWHFPVEIFMHWGQEGPALRSSKIRLGYVSLNITRSFAVHHFACFMAFRYIDVHSMLAEADVAMIEVGSPWFTCWGFCWARAVPCEWGGEPRDTRETSGRYVQSSAHATSICFVYRYQVTWNWVAETRWNKMK